MKISIPIIYDTDNSYPSGELEISLDVDGDTVSIKTSDSDRVVSVMKENFSKLLLALLS